MSTSRLLVKRAVGAAKKLPTNQPKTQLSSVVRTTVPENHQFENQQNEKMMYITFASAESDFNAGAVLGEVPSMSLLKQEAKESIESTYSFASAESDFSTMSWPEVDQMNEYKIGKGLSFASAESDFVSGFSMPEITKSELELEMESSISQNYSFSSG